MQYFIGTVPSDGYKQQIETFRNRWVSNRLKDVVEPHITVKAQGGLTEDMRWLNNVRETCQTFKSFNLSISGPAAFGNAVVFLGVESEEIHNLHKRLVDAVSPSPKLRDTLYLSSPREICRTKGNDENSRSSVSQPASAARRVHIWLDRYFPEFLMVFMDWECKSMVLQDVKTVLDIIT